MIDHLNWTATYVFVGFFVLITVLGFAAGRWRSGDLNDLTEWGLGGRRFGAWVTWFLLGGDLYTAYTVIAVPALIYALGAFGFFAVPYTIIVYPFIFLTMPRLWNVAHKHGYVTGADFIRGRYGVAPLEWAVAFTGILATMPYIALQLVGMEKVIEGLGFAGTGWTAHVPLTVAFVILALYTYSSGLRAPALIAFVKDIMIYIFIIAAVIIIPAKLGGFGAIFADAGKFYAGAAAANPKYPGGLILHPAQIAPFITLALGSAMALFMYPHAQTGTLAAKSADSIRRNAVALPAYSLVLGFIALLGLMGHAAGIKVANPQDIVPQLVLKMFPSWFVGFCFAAIAIGALVPAAIMSIAAANTFTRNIWRSAINPALPASEEAKMAKLVSLIVKLGALLAVFFMPTLYAINLQLLGGVWVLQIFPAIVLGLYTRWFNGWALLAGWAVGMGYGTWISYVGGAWVPVSVAPLLHMGMYNGLMALVANVVVAGVLSAVMAAVGQKASDVTKVGDFDDAPAVRA